MAENFYEPESKGGVEREQEEITEQFRRLVTRLAYRADKDTKLNLLDQLSQLLSRLDSAKNPDNAGQMIGAMLAQGERQISEQSPPNLKIIRGGKINASKNPGQLISEPWQRKSQIG